MSLVLTGVSTLKSLGKKNIMAPAMEENPNLRYDSINNEDDGHYIVFENEKTYPGYLITYK